MEIAESKETASPSSNRKASRRNLVLLTMLGILCVSQVVTLYLLYESNQAPESLVVVYKDDRNLQSIIGLASP